MTWKGFAKGVLFCAAMISSVSAGHLFYMDRFASGGMLLMLTALFLFYALADLRIVRKGEDEFSGSDLQLRKTVSDLVVLVAENAVNNAKHIGRTLPYSPAELSKLEDTLLPLLTELQVASTEKQRITQEFDKLRSRFRQNEGRRALSGKRF